MTAPREPWFASLRAKAAKQPLGVDISDFSDEFCAGFLRGQENMLDALGDPTTWPFHDVLDLAQAILDTTYPGNVFTGERGDAGPRFVVRLREAIAECRAAYSQSVPRP